MIAGLTWRADRPAVAAYGRADGDEFAALTVAGRVTDVRLRRPRHRGWSGQGRTIVVLVRGFLKAVRNPRTYGGSGSCDQYHGIQVSRGQAVPGNRGVQVGTSPAEPAGHAAPMPLQRIKMVVAASWTVVTTIAIVARVSWPLHLAIAAVCLSFRRLRSSSGGTNPIKRRPRPSTRFGEAAEGVLHPLAFLTAALSGLPHQIRDSSLFCVSSRAFRSSLSSDSLASLRCRSSS